MIFAISCLIISCISLAFSIVAYRASNKRLKILQEKYEPNPRTTRRENS